MWKNLHGYSLAIVSKGICNDRSWWYKRLAMKTLMPWVKDIVHVNAVLSFAAVSLEVKFTKLLFLVWHNMLMLKLALIPLQEKNSRLQEGCAAHMFSRINLFKVLLLSYLDASALQKVLADVSTIVLNCVLIYELLAHNQPFLLKTTFSILKKQSLVVSDRWFLICW